MKLSHALADARVWLILCARSGEFEVGNGV
jgi:hypothetical protein